MLPPAARGRSLSIFICVWAWLGLLSLTFNHPLNHLTNALVRYRSNAVRKAQVTSVSWIRKQLIFLSHIISMKAARVWMVASQCRDPGSFYLILSHLQPAVSISWPNVAALALPSHLHSCCWEAEKGKENSDSLRAQTRIFPTWLIPILLAGISHLSYTAARKAGTVVIN